MRKRAYISLPVKGMPPFGVIYNHNWQSYDQVPLHEERDFAPFIKNLQTHSNHQSRPNKKAAMEHFVRRIWGGHLSTVEPIIRSLPQYGIDEFIVNYVLHSAKLIQVICDFMATMRIDSNKKQLEFPFLRPNTYTALLDRDFGAYSIDTSEHVVKSIKAYCEDMKIDFNADCSDLPFMDRRRSELALRDEIKRIMTFRNKDFSREIGVSALCFEKMHGTEESIRRCNRFQIEVALYSCLKITN